MLAAAVHIMLRLFMATEYRVSLYPRCHSIVPPGTFSYETMKNRLDIRDFRKRLDNCLGTTYRRFSPFTTDRHLYHSHLI